MSLEILSPTSLTRASAFLLTFVPFRLRPPIRLRSGRVGGSGGGERFVVSKLVVLIRQTLVGTRSSTAHTTAVWSRGGWGLGEDPRCVRQSHSFRDRNQLGGRTSIDEWNQLARGLLIRSVDISEFFGQQSLLDPDPVKENRDQG